MGQRCPVRMLAGSKLRGSFEKGFFRPLTKAERKEIRRAADQYDSERRTGNRYSGPFTPATHHVLELLLNFTNDATGQLDPSIDTIARCVDWSRMTVIDALKRLEAHGFLKRQRRYVYVDRGEGDTGRGPLKQQTTSAYRVMLPPKMRRAKNLPPPLPDDEVQRPKEQAEDLKRYLAELSPGAFPSKNRKLREGLLKFAKRIESPPPAMVRHDIDKGGLAIDGPASCEEDCAHGGGKQGSA